ncbi:MAG: ADP-ribosylglycohydrolase family protein [Bacteroidota bacterium]
MDPDRARGALLGLATGDAVGTTLEFKPRGTFEPITDMVGGGPFALESGQWTDDTAMALALAESLLACTGHDPVDQLERYVRWWRHGETSCTGHCFDIGNTVRDALQRYLDTGTPDAGPTHPHTAGNGSIMRLAPVVLAYAPDPKATVAAAAASSRTTHGAPEAIDACRLLAEILLRALGGADRDATLAPVEGLRATDALATVASSTYRGNSAEHVRGSGYVVESLEAALWAVATTASFADAVLRAANLGDDADTTAAIAGQVAGALYGASGIPPHWLNQLAWRDRLEDTADALLALRPTDSIQMS